MCWGWPQTSQTMFKCLTASAWSWYWSVKLQPRMTSPPCLCCWWLLEPPAGLCSSFLCVWLSDVLVSAACRDLPVFSHLHSPKTQMLVNQWLQIGSRCECVLLLTLWQLGKAPAWFLCRDFTLPKHGFFLLKEEFFLPAFCDLILYK